jgi:WD40 repeat protein
VLRVFEERPDLEEKGNFAISDVSFSSDGRLVATADTRGFELDGMHVEIWDWQKAMLVRKVQGATIVEFDPSGPRIVTVAAGRAEIQDAESGRLIAALATPSRDISAVAFGPDGSVVATGYESGAVRLFDADTGNLRLTLPGNAGAVNDLSFNQDGTMLASTSHKDGVRVWALDIDELLEIAWENVTRPFTDEECLQYLHEDPCPPSHGHQTGH